MTDVIGGRVNLPPFYLKTETQRRRPCEDGGRDWSDVATNQGVTRSWRGREGLSPRVYVGIIVLLISLF